jgi:RNA polymerase subunit RPABC4/transcription elongation factor Spt4
MNEAYHCLDCDHFYGVDESSCPECGSNERSYWDYYDMLGEEG